MRDIAVAGVSKYDDNDFGVAMSELRSSVVKESGIL